MIPTALAAQSAIKNALFWDGPTLTSSRGGRTWSESVEWKKCRPITSFVTWRPRGSWPYWRVCWFNSLTDATNTGNTFNENNYLLRFLDRGSFINFYQQQQQQPPSINRCNYRTKSTPFQKLQDFEDNCRPSCWEPLTQLQRWPCASCSSDPLKFKNSTAL